MNILELKAKVREITNTSTQNYSDESLVRDINSEILQIQISILRDRGPFEFDDPNHFNLPVATFNVYAGTSTYKILTDAFGTPLLTKNKVAFQAGDEWQDVPRITPGESNQEALTAGGESDVPGGYYEQGEAITFVPTPKRNGKAKVWFDRIPLLVRTTDTLREPGIPLPYHNLLAYRVAHNYAIDKGLPNENSILRRVALEEERLQEFEETRRGDESVSFSVTRVSGL